MMSLDTRASSVRKPMKRKLALKADVGSSGPLEGRGVVYVKHIPNGFFEPEMLDYFKQFGDVTRLRLSRSKRTGRSKGYAFVEFASETVAQIAAKSMEDYLMFRQRLQCKYLDPADVHPELFKGANRPFSKPKAVALARERHNRPQPENRLAAGADRLRRKNTKQLAAFKEFGYELPGVMTKEEINKTFRKSIATPAVAPDAVALTKTSPSQKRGAAVGGKPNVGKAAKAKGSGVSAAVKSNELKPSEASPGTKKKRGAVSAGEKKNSKKGAKRLKIE